jgi:hypothetical protein
MRPPDLSGNPTSSHLVAKKNKMPKKIITFALRSISFTLRRVFNMLKNLTDMGPTPK